MNSTQSATGMGPFFQQFPNRYSVHELEQHQDVHLVTNGGMHGGNVGMVESRLNLNLTTEPAGRNRDQSLEQEGSPSWRRLFPSSRCRTFSTMPIPPRPRTSFENLVTADLIADVEVGTGPVHQRNVAFDRWHNEPSLSHRYSGVSAGAELKISICRGVNVGRKAVNEISR